MSKGGENQITGDQPQGDFMDPAFDNSMQLHPMPMAVPSPGGKGGSIPMQQPSPGGKGGGQVGTPFHHPMPFQQPTQVPFYAQQAPMPVGPFDNTGRITDSSLLAQQGILNRPQNSYQPLVTPDTYQNFYGNQQANVMPNIGGVTGGEGILAPDYRPMAQTFANDELIRRVARETGGSDSGQPYYGVDTSVGGSSGVTQDMLDAANASTDPIGTLIAEIAASTPVAAPIVTGPSDPVGGSSVTDAMIDAANASNDPIGTLIGSIGSIPGSTPAPAPIVSYTPPPVTSNPNVYSSSSSSGSPVGDGRATSAVTDSEGNAVTDSSGNAVTSSGSGEGSSKIVCTAMNHAYGFGSFRNAIWIAYADKHLTKAHEVGYHTLFLPLVDFGFKRGDGKLNMTVRKVLEWGTRHRSTDLRAELRHTKRDTTGRIIRFIFEPLCYTVGKLKGY